MSRSKPLVGKSLRQREALCLGWPQLQISKLVSAWSGYLFVCPRRLVIDQPPGVNDVFQHYDKDILENDEKTSNHLSKVIAEESRTTPN